MQEIFRLSILVVLLCLAIVGMHFSVGPNAISRESHMQDQIGIDRNSYYRRRYFFIDKTGKVVIDASKYESVLGFSEGLAAVRDGQGWGFIDKDGKELMETRFQAVDSFSEGLAAVQVEDLWGFIDREGRMVIEPQYESANPFSEGIAVVVRGKSRNPSHPVEMDGSQSIVVQSRVVRRKRVLVGGPTADLSSDEAAQIENKEVLLIDRNGQTILTRSTEELQLNMHERSRFSEGLIDAYDCASRKIGFIDKTGGFVIEPRYRQAAPFSEGLARVAVEENGEEILRFIDHSGDFKMWSKFNTDADFSRNSTDFSEGLASLTEGLRPTVTDEAKFVYIDNQGVIVLHTSFFCAGRFRDGFASVYDAEKDAWGFIDKSGKVVIPIKYYSVSDFSDGLASVGILTK